MHFTVNSGILNGLICLINIRLGLDVPIKLYDTTVIVTLPRQHTSFGVTIQLVKQSFYHIILLNINTHLF